MPFGSDFENIEGGHIDPQGEIGGIGLNKDFPRLIAQPIYNFQIGTHPHTTP